MIFAFARAGAALDDARYVRVAARAARFVRNRLYDAKTGTLRRFWKEKTAQIPGFAEDYAFLIQALLDLYQASADSQALEWAIALQRKQDELFWDAMSAGYFESAAEDQLVKVRLKQDHDGAEPSANSVSALNLLRLSRCSMKSTTQTAPNTFSPPSLPHRRTRPRPPLKCLPHPVLTERTASGRDCGRPPATGNQAARP